MPRTNSIIGAIVLIFLFTCGSLSGRNLETYSAEALNDLYEELYQQASSTNSIAELPALDSIVKLTNGTKYAVVIWDAKTIHNKATFSALLSVSIPNDDQKLIFYASEVSFSNSTGI